ALDYAGGIRDVAARRFESAARVLDPYSAMKASNPTLTCSQVNFFFASSGTSTFVLPTSLISTVVVRSRSRSSPLKLTVPETLYSYLASWPSLIQNFTEPLAFLASGAAPPP